MTAALVVAATSPLTAAVLAVLVRTRGPMPEASISPGAAYVAAYLADRSWRDDQIRQVRDHYALTVAVAEARQEWAIRTVYTDRPPLEPRSPRGIDVISQWWPVCTDTIGRPPLTARRIPGATMTGAAA